MKQKNIFKRWLVFVVILALVGGSEITHQARAQEWASQSVLAPQAEVSTVFTYQGRLTDDSTGEPITGPCDFQFGLWDAATDGTPIGNSPQTSSNVSLDNGYFSVALDFGDGGLGPATFAGDARWLAIAVRCPAGSGSYIPLNGRVALNAAPYALSLRPGAMVAGDRSGGTVLIARNTTTGSFGAGFKAETNATQGTALIAESKSSSLQQTYGIYATTASRGGTAVYGESKYGGSTQNNVAYGGYFKANAFGDVGVYGESVWGQGYGVGVWGKTAAPYGDGVHGVATATSGENHGVYGETDSTEGSGVYGKSAAAGGFGVYGYSRYGDAVHGKSPDGYAIYAEGDAHVTGDLTWNAKQGHLSIPPAAFQPQTHNIEFNNLGYALIQGGGGICNAQKLFMAPVVLPHHATVIKLEYHAWTQGPFGISDKSCATLTLRLLRHNFTTGLEEMAALEPTADYSAGTYFSEETTTIQYGGVNNDDYQYYLELSAPGGGVFVWFYGAQITYTFYEPY
ncbi:MAG: hypothetical protein WHX52_00520 [Anaerolineae bacterium]